MNKISTELIGMVKMTGLVFVILKLFNLIDWGWLLVLLPFQLLIIPPVLVLAALWCAYFFRRIRRRRRR